MMTALPHSMVIVNPVAGAYSTRRKWPRINSWLRRIGLPFDYEFTEGAGHAIELARAAVGGGYRCLMAVGGDGTVNEVANGILSAAGSDGTSLSVVGTGTGTDFIRSVGIPRYYDSACAASFNSRRVVIDVGVVEYWNEGQKQRRFFVNAAGVGFDATVVQATQSLPKYFGGTIPYLAGLLRSLVSYRNKVVDLRLGDMVRTGRISAVVVANGGYLGGGMHIAPQARVDDGLLDVVTIGDVGKFELLRALPTVYNGTHVSHPKVSISRARHIAIESSEEVLVHADGELLGTCPASFWLMPLALNIII